MTESARLRIPYLAASQAQKHVTHNEALTLLDTLCQASVIDKDLSTPPVSPTEGDCYIIAATGTGAWIGWDNRIARFIDGEWRSYLPGAGDGEGWLVYVQDEQTIYVFNGTAWSKLYATASIVTPGGRLTNSTGAPVPTADVAGAGTIYYTPYLHQGVPIYDGVRFLPTDIGGELSQALSDTAKSPAAAQAYSCYDLFVWNDAGTIRCTRGPAWAKSATCTMTIASPCAVSMTAHGGQNGDPVTFSTTGALPTGLVAGTEYYLLGQSTNAFNVSATPFAAAINTSGSQSGTHMAVVRSSVSRYSGAGTSEIERVKGVWVNKQAVTNGPAAQRGTYVGTIRTNASSQVDLKFGSLAALGGTAALGIWNLYNRVPVAGLVMDDTNSWTYNSTWRAFNGSSSNLNNRVELIRGLNEDSMSAVMNSMVTNPAGAAGHLGIGVDSTSVNSGTSFEGTVSTSGGAFSSWRGFAGLGFHRIYALEHIQGSGSVTFYGDNNFSGKPYQSGLAYDTRY